MFELKVFLEGNYMSENQSENSMKANADLAKPRASRTGANSRNSGKQSRSPRNRDTSSGTAKVKARPAGAANAKRYGNRAKTDDRKNSDNRRDSNRNQEDNSTERNDFRLDNANKRNINSHNQTRKINRHTRNRQRINNQDNANANTRQDENINKQGRENVQPRENIQARSNNQSENTHPSNNQAVNSGQRRQGNRDNAKDNFGKGDNRPQRMRDKKPRRRRKTANIPVDPKIVSEHETVEDIRKDIAYIERELELEIESIRNMYL